MADWTPESRVEEILFDTINGDPYNGMPESRIEELLLELKAVIEEGGGGGNNAMYPWMNQLDATNAGFQNAQLASQLSGIQASINANNNAAMQTGFNIQTAIMNGNSTLAAQLAQCCCENRLATANLQSVIQSENCADRAAINDGVRDILANQNAGIQRILDQMCSDKIDAKNEKIADLERQLSMASLAASQLAQTAQLEDFIRSNSTTTPTT